MFRISTLLLLAVLMTASCTKSVSTDSSSEPAAASQTGSEPTALPTTAAAAAAAADGAVWGEASGGLRLGLELDASKMSAKLLLENVGGQPLSVLSHVSTGDGDHLDWYRIELRNESGEVRQLGFFGDRDRSARIRRDLAPGERLSHEVSLATWAAHMTNGANPIASGVYDVSATYEVADAGAWWSGRVGAGPVELDATGND